MLDDIPSAALKKDILVCGEVFSFSGTRSWSELCVMLEVPKLHKFTVFYVFIYSSTHHGMHFLFNDHGFWLGEVLANIPASAHSAHQYFILSQAEFKAVSINFESSWW